MRDFLDYVAKQLVDTPDAVQITEEEKDNNVIFKIKVAQADIGKIIGKQGRTAEAIRVLLCAVAEKTGKRAILEVEDYSESVTASCSGADTQIVRSEGGIEGRIILPHRRRTAAVGTSAVGRQ